jgi:outer membrane protein assembly factor BamA
MNKKFLLACGLLAFSAQSMAFDWMPDRRKDQYPTVPAHLVVPLPYSKPGIGSGLIMLGTLSNTLDTTADISAFIVTGDASGYILHGDEIPVLSKNLFLQLDVLNINKASVNNYDFRGMNNTGKNDFTLLDVSLAKEFNAEVNLTFFERRLNFYYLYSDAEYRIDAISDHNGNLITQLDDSFENEENGGSLRFALDFTDDYQDPRNGIRFDFSYQDHEQSTVDDPDFYTLDISLLAYIPIAGADTLVINYLKSDAHVRRQGNTNPVDIRAELGANCDASDQECLQAESEIVNNFINTRTHGTSMDLGGDLRLRSYPQGRFSGAHTAFLAAEYRWNITQEATPFDFFFWKDVRTGYQIAFFAEMGSVSETSSEIWDEKRYSYGTGFRLVSASGSIYRADFAYGDEGSELTVIFEYPWE